MMAWIHPSCEEKQDVTYAGISSYPVEIVKLYTVYMQKLSTTVNFFSLTHNNQGWSLCASP